MRRIAAILATAGAAAILLVAGTGAGGETDAYEVRAVFANGSFLVPGEEVRIAGAKVGQISEVDVTGADEAAHEDGSSEPGSAVVVMSIDDPAFQDFREDASCLIRPQGLLGERFVECRATEPRAAGSDPPPSLEPIEEDEPGAGQYLLALERNGKAVDLDLVNSIMEAPYPDRFRLILNDLGAGFAARGEDIEELIERANPALQRTDEVLRILARQNRDLAGLARDSDQVLTPLARERDRISGFINNATVAGQATAERRADLEAGLQKLPGFLTELRATMTELDEFAQNTTPVISDLGDAAPSLTRMTEALGPFSRGGLVALTSLGDAAEDAGPSLVAADPVLIRIREVAKASGPLGRLVSDLFGSLRRNKAYRNLAGFLFNAAGATNAYDSFGRLARLVIPVNNCVDYRPNPESSCESFFSTTSARGPATVAPKPGALKRLLRSGRTDDPERGEIRIPDLGLGAFGGGGDDADSAEPPDSDSEETEEPEALNGSQPSAKGTELLLDYLLGQQTAAARAPAPGGGAR